MGHLNLTINDELDKQFRHVAYRRMGMKKGYLTDGVEEAIKVLLGFVKLKDMSSTKDNKLWPEEEQALEDIMSGKTKMVTQSGEDFLKDLETTINAMED